MLYFIFCLFIEVYKTEGMSEGEYARNFKEAIKASHRRYWNRVKQKAKREAALAKKTKTINYFHYP